MGGACAVRSPNAAFFHPATKGPFDPQGSRIAGSAGTAVAPLIQAAAAFGCSTCITASRCWRRRKLAKLWNLCILIRLFWIDKDGWRFHLQICGVNYASSHAQKMFETGHGRLLLPDKLCLKHINNRQEKSRKSDYAGFGHVQKAFHWVSDEKHGQTRIIIL